MNARVKLLLRLTVPGELCVSEVAREHLREIDRIKILATENYLQCLSTNMCHKISSFCHKIFGKMLS